MPNIYIVATPIGNLEDITLRALRILREVDFILCEDTRVTKKLLARHAIGTPTLSYHQHSNEKKVADIKRRLFEGKNIALVTDAGTPGIADPGNRLIAALLTEGTDTRIVPIPGPAAVIAALSIAGVPTDEFLFLGFLPHKKGRQTSIQEIVASARTVIVYESPHRIVKFLQQLITQGVGERRIMVARELTKLHESVYRGAASEVLAAIEKSAHGQKGEFVVVIAPRDFLV